MQQRVGHTNLLLRSKKLFHKYVCDAMAKISLETDSKKKDEMYKDLYLKQYIWQKLLILK